MVLKCFGMLVGTNLILDLRATPFTAKLVVIGEISHFLYINAFSLICEDFGIM